MIVIFVSKICLKVKESCENCRGATQGEGKQKDAFGHPVTFVWLELF